MRSFFTAAILFFLLYGKAQSEAIRIDVKKTATCGCCQAWVNHLKQSGYHVSAQNVAMSVLANFKRQHGVPIEHQSCHTGRVVGYTIEGHVPAREIERLIKNRPDAIGLSVPGMPIGSPGMEVGTEREAYDVLLLKKDGSTEIFASYTSKP